MPEPVLSEREQICAYIETEAKRQNSAGVRRALTIIAEKVRARFDEVDVAAEPEAEAP